MDIVVKIIVAAFTVIGICSFVSFVFSLICRKERKKVRCSIHVFLDTLSSGRSEFIMRNVMQNTEKICAGKCDITVHMSGLSEEDKHICRCYEREYPNVVTVDEKINVSRETSV